MNIRQATRSYEDWLFRQTPVIGRDLRLKHALMRESPFRFLRATFYRWLEQWPTVCADVASAPRVLAVADLHIENFGTWRDAEGRLVWGINDFDEVCDLPYTQDLVRLATSALLAIQEGHFAIRPRDAVVAILEGYGASLDRGGRPFVLAERRRWLRQIALSELRDPGQFWSHLAAAPPATGEIPHAALRSLFPQPGLRYRVVHRVAGLGSLGRPRFVALAEWGGALIAREAKRVVPSAAVWIAGRSDNRADANRLLRSPIRTPDPFFRVERQWTVRRLAPDCTKIELTDIPRDRDERRLLRAMGFETANVHLTTRGARIQSDLRSRKGKWLESAAQAMAGMVREDWKAWSH